MSTLHSFLSNADPAYIDGLYQVYREDPESVEPGWRKFFEGFDFAIAKYGEDGGPEESSGNVKEIYVLNLINEYRSRGHLFTRTNPVRERRKYTPTLDLENFHLSDDDLDTVFQAGVDVGLGPAKLRDILELVTKTYRQSLGVEYMHIRKPEINKWLRDEMESRRNVPRFTLDEKRHILQKLNEAVVFEKFLGQKFVGQKRFSLEGAEALIPAMDAVIEHGAELGIEEMIIGMAHRGRLNVLANIMGKTYEDVFGEFEENVDTDFTFDGDVKYHHGYSSDMVTDNGKTVHLSLTPNPSHLESVDPVAVGKARAKIDNKHNRDHNKLATILLHGDAALAAQGVVYEVIQMSELPAYETGGTIHIVINNQVGFTTNYLEARSSTYCTDVAKVIQSPVFHVNGDDAEAVVYACKLGMEFRQRWNKDVFIDLLCYRRHGHNEGDEPRFTQPTLYKIIEKHPNPREIYFQRLLEAGDVQATLAKEMEKSFKKMLQARLNSVKEDPKSVQYSFMHSGWKKLRMERSNDWTLSLATGVDVAQLKKLSKPLTYLPDGMTFYDKMVKIFNDRRKMIEETDRLDWAMGELLAYASLLDEGYPVRLSGQDSARGTFAHRHSILKVNDSEDEYIPLEHISENQAKFEVYNSLLSEYAVLGFEYGYSWSAPYTLVLWEAQFGDFVNGAQIIIDQYIASSESKWLRLSGLVMLLPHGYEGQGPEHSSARMERFLEVCAGNNLQVVNPTNPAQIFHLLRRQILREFRVPLIVFTPKSLLRLKDATSSLADLGAGTRFHEVIDDAKADPEKVTRVLVCSGKVYYDLVKFKTAENREEVAVVRMEQIYPLPFEQLNELKKKYSKAEAWIWVQEEPENMGAWSFILRKTPEIGFQGVYRKESASPATGYKKEHTAQQEEIVKQAFGDLVALPSNHKVLASNN